jgi:hypothetical protein
MSADPVNFKTGSYLPAELVDVGSELMIGKLLKEDSSMLERTVAFQVGEFFKLSQCEEVAQKAKPSPAALAGQIYQERLKQLPAHKMELPRLVAVDELEKAGLPICKSEHYSFLGLIRSLKTTKTGLHFALLHFDSLPGHHEAEDISNLVGPFVARCIVQRRNKPGEEDFLPVPTEAEVKEMDSDVAEGRKEYEEVATQHMRWQLLTVDVPMQQFGSSSCGLSTLLFQEHFFRADHAALCSALNKDGTRRMQLLKLALDLTDLSAGAYEGRRKQLEVDFATWMREKNVGLM